MNIDQVLRIADFFKQNDKERFYYSTQYESYFAFDQLVNGGSASCVDPDSPYFDSPQCQQGWNLISQC